MALGFIIWTIVASIFLIIGLNCWKAREAVGFFTGAKPPKVKNVTAYNHAVAKVWFLFTIILEIIGIPILFVQQNSPVMLVVIGATVILVIAIMIAYTQVEKKYRA